MANFLEGLLGKIGQMSGSSAKTPDNSLNPLNQPALNVSSMANQNNSNQTAQNEQNNRSFNMSPVDLTWHPEGDTDAPEGYGYSVKNPLSNDREVSMFDPSIRPDAELESGSSYDPSIQPDAPSSNGESYLSPEAQLWGKHYQGGKDINKMEKFDADMRGPENADIRNAIGGMSGVFSEDETGMSSENFENLLYNTGYHESGAIGGTPRTSQGYLDNSGNWTTEGPARSYWQVEPDTLRDLVTARQVGGGSNVSSAYWGPKATKATGYSAQDLYNMSDDELSQLLEDDQRLGAVAAGGKYVKSLKADTPENSTIDNYNRVEDAFTY